MRAWMVLVNLLGALGGAVVQSNAAQIEASTNAAAAPSTNSSAAGRTRKVYVLPIRDDIMPPLVYLVRRGVKEAMEGTADLLVLDMETDGGSVKVTEEIIGIL